MDRTLQGMTGPDLTIKGTSSQLGLMSLNSIYPARHIPYQGNMLIGVC